MISVDLNCDLGESFGAYTIGMDEAVIPLITSANVACGYHAGDPLVMAKTVARCREAGVHVGAHPGFPDLMGFGRRNLDVTPAEARAYTLYQLGALDAFCKAHGMKLQHVKPHGAMYNMAGKDYALAKGICEAIKEYNPELIVMALSSGELVHAAEDMGLKVAREVFADRAYEEDGSLVNRRKEGAMITDENEAIARVVRMIKEQKVTAITGKDIPIKADSVCVHGDGAKALAFVKKIRETLGAEGIEITPLVEIIKYTTVDSRSFLSNQKNETAEIFPENRKDLLSLLFITQAMSQNICLHENLKSAAIIKRNLRKMFLMVFVLKVFTPSSTA